MDFEASAPSPTTPLGPTTPRGPTREFRAAVTFMVGAALILFVLLLALGSAPSGPPVRWVVALVGPFATMVALGAAAVGLANRAAWATAAMLPLLLVVIASGAISFAFALTHSTLELPIGLLLAIWALRAPPSSAPGSPGLRAIAIVIIPAITAVWGIPVQALTQPGGPLIADEAALAPALAVTCDGPQGREPTAVHVRYDWRWLRAEPWVAGNDVIRLQAFSANEDGEPRYALDEITPLPAGMWQSDISIFEPLGIDVGIDLGTTGFSTGSVGFSLIVASEPAIGPGELDVKATYVHGPDGTTDVDGPALWRVTRLERCQW